MATSTSTDDRVTIAVPAAYLEDFRTAVLAELKDDCRAMTMNQTSYVEAISDGREVRVSRADRDMAIRQVGDQAALLAQLPTDQADATVVASEGDLLCTLVTLGELWTKQLVASWGFEPEDVSATAALVERLSWCVEQAEAVV